MRARELLLGEIGFDEVERLGQFWVACQQKSSSIDLERTCLAGQDPRQELELLVLNRDITFIR